MHFSIYKLFFQYIKPSIPTGFGLTPWTDGDTHVENGTRNKKWYIPNVELQNDKQFLKLLNKNHTECTFQHINSSLQQGLHYLIEIVKNSPIRFGVSGFEILGETMKSSNISFHRALLTNSFGQGTNEITWRIFDGTNLEKLPVIALNLIDFDSSIFWTGECGDQGGLCASC